MTVYLVGAGPGDPGLMTARSLDLIASADVIIYDRLIAHSLLDLAPPGAERIDGSGKTLLPGLFRTLVRNVGRGFPDTALFETGLVFHPRPGAPAPGGGRWF